MPQNFKDTISLPIAIPAWGLICLLAVGIYTAGNTMQKLDQVIESSKKIDTIQERQIGALARLQAHENQLQNHEARLIAMERRMSRGEK